MPPRALFRQLDFLTGVAACKEYGVSCGITARLDEGLGVIVAPGRS